MNVRSRQATEGKSTVTPTGEDTMKKLIMLALAITGMALAASKTYTVNLLQPAKLAGMDLKAGEYRIEVVDESKAIIKNGKMHGEAAVKVETGSEKYGS